jgi:antitoxin component YwqK of YwqJK toxin-antitoxin module
VKNNYIVDNKCFWLGQYVRASGHISHIIDAKGKSKKTVIVLLLLLFVDLANCISLSAQSFKGADSISFLYTGHDFQKRIALLFNKELLPDTTINKTDTVHIHFKNEFRTQNQVEKFKVIVEYRKGVKIKATSYYSGGQISDETFFNEIGLHGTCVAYYRNGNRMYWSYYENNTLKSPEIAWHEDGTLKSFADEKTNINIGWFPNRQVEYVTRHIPTEEYPKCFLDSVYWENGQLRSVVMSNGGIQPTIAYHKNGKKAQEGTIIDAIWYRIGKWTEWHENGKIYRECFFSETVPNIKEGTWREWDESGSLLEEYIFENDSLIEQHQYLPEKMRKSNDE